MKRALPIGIMTVLLAACSQGPEDVAEDFWRANQDGDAEAVRALVSSSNAMPIRYDRPIPTESFSVGDAVVDGTEADVETTLMIDVGEGGTEREVTFATAMVQDEDGTWKVDIYRTTGRMMGRLIGVTFDEMSGQYGEMMEGVTEGMAEGMREFGEAMEAAIEEAAAESRNP